MTDMTESIRPAITGLRAAGAPPLPKDSVHSSAITVHSDNSPTPTPAPTPSQFRIRVESESESDYHYVQSIQS